MIVCGRSMLGVVFPERICCLENKVSVLIIDERAHKSVHNWYTVGNEAWSIGQFAQNVSLIENPAFYLA